MIPASRAAKAYYPELPDSQHRTGDIWTGLPTFGLFANPDLATAPGLVITPACDLSNCKAPTITYLPVLSVRALLATDWGYTVARPVLVEILDGRHRGDLAEMLERGKVPDSTTLQLLQNAHAEGIDGLSDEQKERLRCGLEALDGIRTGRFQAAASIRGLLKAKDWQKLINSLVTNGHSDDVHFLPPEYPVYDFSAVKEPSVVAFRYPITLPRTILDAAGSTSEKWASVRDGLATIYQQQFVAQPVKVTRLEREFLADLLTRFARLYVRLGSADFTRDAVQALSAKIDEAC